MFRKRTVPSIAIVLMLSALSSSAVNQKENEPQSIIKSARFLEENPLDKKANEVRQKAVELILQKDKASVLVCGVIMNIEMNYKYKPELTLQFAIGKAAYKFEHPDKATDEPASRLAGVESVIVAYQSILKGQPKAHEESMDQLVSKRGDGSLADFLAKADNCEGIQ